MNSETPPDDSPAKPGWFRQSLHPFRIAMLRGMAVVLPPLLTILLFVWAWNTIDKAVLRPVESLSQTMLVWAIHDIRVDEEILTLAKQANPPGSNLFEEDGVRIFQTAQGVQLVQKNNEWLPKSVVDLVDRSPTNPSPTSANDYYRRYVQLRYLKRHLVIPAFLAIFLALMYMTGKLLAVGIGRIFWNWFETFIDQIPIIRNVYSSVKQVTDFAFSENNIDYTRVVAIEYPRKGIWSIGFVTGESFLDLHKAAGEPMLSVLMPTSPMPATGFTITVPKSETVDLDITIDQAIQFCVSCGVVVPDHQMAKSAIEGQVRRKNQLENQTGARDKKNQKETDE